jgi:hypothetical protein
MLMEINHFARKVIPTDAGNASLEMGARSLRPGTSR